MMSKRSSAALLALIPAFAFGVNAHGMRALQAEDGAMSMDFDEDQVCSNGVRGVQNGNACCVIYCGACGGAGCSTFGADLMLGASDCCSSEINEFGLTCSETGGEAPCIIDDDEETFEPEEPVEEPEEPEEPEVPSEPECSDGTPGFQNGNACCAPGCGACGGALCFMFGRSLGLDAFDCCRVEILDTAESCAATGGVAPCVIAAVDMPAEPEPTDNGVCSDGTLGIQAGEACCAAGCGGCGGTGCSMIGAALDLGAEDCCTSDILVAGVSCAANGGVAPCIVGDDEAEPVPPVDVCSDGTPGIQTGDACCVAACGQCGGAGCSTAGAAMDLGAPQCCTADIMSLGMSCSAAGGIAPCIVGDDIDMEPTFEPVTPLTIDEPMCSNGVIGVEDMSGDICCASGCAQCGGPGCSTTSLPDLGADECCTGEIFEAGWLCDVTDMAPCIIPGIGMPEDDDMDFSFSFFMDDDEIITLPFNPIN